MKIGLTIETVFFNIPEPFSQYSSGREHSVGYIERMSSLDWKEEETDRHNIVHLMDIVDQVFGPG